MKPTANLLMITAALVSLTLPQITRAEDNWTGLYMRVDAGGTLVQDTDLREFFGPVIPGSKVTFDPGFRLGLDFGYNFNEWAALEGEVGMLYNDISKIGGAYHSDASLLNMPLLLNLRFQWPNRSRLKPFIGVGVGGMESLLDMNDVSYTNFGSPTVRHISGNATDFVFACQGFAGVRFELNEQLGLSLEYRYLHASSPSFDIDWGWFWNVYTTQAKFGTLDAHLISLALDYQF